MRFPLSLLTKKLDKGLVAAVFAKVQALAIGSKDPRLLYHEEVTESGEIKTTRIERIVDIDDPNVNKLYAEVHDLLEETQGVRLRLLKEKVNWKHKGGGVYLAHQDTPAFRPYGTEHVSALIPFTEYTQENGALEISSTAWSHDKVEHTMEELARMDYVPMLASPGDILIFDGWVPHRSGPNTESIPRVGWYLTFGLDAELTPEAREDYYDEKARSIDGMSLNQKDYTGKLLPPYTPCKEE